MIAKYLYEKKGYPIDLNGNIPSFDETMKDVEQYSKYKEDKFIEKACEWMSNHLSMQYGRIIIYNGFGSFIKNFRKAMKKK